jgi:DNA-binding transcriptional LysR family regulator
MKLSWLEAYRIVMHAGTEKEAAARLHLTQPAISRMISKLEGDLGFKLFLRKHGRLMPTVEGEQFFREAERVILGISEIQRIGSDIRQHRGANLRVVSMPSIGKALLPQVVKRFVEQYPRVHVSLEVRSHSDVEYWIASNQYDVGLSVLPVDNPAVETDDFVEVRLVAAIPCASPLAHHDVVSLTDLAKETFIFLPPHLLLGRQTKEAFAAQGLEPQARVVTSSLSLACQMVAQGIGVTITDPYTAQEVPPDSIVVRDISPKMPRFYGFLFPSGRARSIPARHFVRLVREVAAGKQRLDPIDRA